MTLSGCVRVSAGDPVAQPTGAVRTSTPAPSSTIGTPSAPDDSQPGVLPTQRTPVPANTITCAPPSSPPVSVAAAVADPAAPRITVGVPEGWSFTAGTSDVAVTMQGPQGLSAAVTIASTTLDAAAAFRDYTDRVMATSAMSTVSILPAELCEYSGQRLTGTWSDGPDEGVAFVDRIVHVWTATSDFLIAIHVEGPAGPSSGLAAASSVLTDYVELTIP